MGTPSGPSYLLDTGSPYLRGVKSMWSCVGRYAGIAILAIMAFGAAMVARPTGVAAQSQGGGTCRLDPFDLNGDGYLSRTCLATPEGRR